MLILVTLFISGFTSATLLPGTSEALFLYLLSQQQWHEYLLLLVVGSGNVLGGMSNWVLGWLIQYGLLSRSRKQDKYLARAEIWIQKQGAPVLLLSFLPVIGDPLCVVAGLFKVPWISALIYISLSKFVRYFVLMQFSW